MTKIQWAHETWNPLAGCQKVSLGCKRCYAESMARRLKGMLQPAATGRPGLRIPKFPQYQDVVDENGWTGRTALAKDQLEKPLHWRKPRRVFALSMSDPGMHTADNLRRVWDVVRQCPRHRFLFLTKRPSQFVQTVFLRQWIDLMSPLAHVWFGVSTEDQEWADRRIPWLTRIWPRGRRFVSVEPILGEVNLDEYIRDVDWVVVGGETGSAPRLGLPSWIERIWRTCGDEGTPFFFKSWGAFQYSPGPFTLEAIIEGTRQIPAGLRVNDETI